MKPTFLTIRILFSSLAVGFISGLTGTSQDNILQQVDARNNHGIGSNMDDNQTTLPNEKRVTSKASTFSRQTHNEAGEYKAKAPVKNGQRKFATINRQNSEINDLLKNHNKPTKEGVNKQSLSKPGAIVKKQFLPRIFSGFPGGAWVQDPSGIPRAVYSTSKDPCSDSPCHHNGMCVGQRSGFYCSCRPGYMGSRCEVKRTCQPDTCKNGGTCSEEAMGQHICTCSAGFRGENCGEISRCHPSPCHNGATCTETEDGFNCQCAIGYKGKSCQDTDACFPNPCKSGGTCVETGGNFFCNCPNGNKGKTCEIISECTKSPCTNGATCVDDVEGYRCRCRRGFFGKSCEASACHPTPCKNGGVCMKFGNQFNCRCPHGYNGKLCEVHSPCSQGICLNGGRCLEGAMTTSKDGFACMCPPGYEGIICERRLPEIVNDGVSVNNAV